MSESSESLMNTLLQAEQAGIQLPLSEQIAEWQASQQQGEQDALTLWSPPPRSPSTPAQQQQQQQQQQRRRQQRVPPEETSESEESDDEEEVVYEQRLLNPKQLPNRSWVLPAPTNLQVASGNMIDLRRMPLIVQWNPKTINKFLAKRAANEEEAEMIHRGYQGALLGFRWEAQVANGNNPIESKGYYTFRFQFPYYDGNDAAQKTRDVQIYRKPTTVCKLAKNKFNVAARQAYLPKCNGYDELKYETASGKWKPLKNIIPNTMDNGSLQKFFPIGPSKMKHLPMGWSDSWLINVQKLKEARFIERKQ